MKDVFCKIYKKGADYFYFLPYGDYKIQRFSVKSGKGYYPLSIEKWEQVMLQTQWEETGWEVKDLEAFKLYLAL